MVKPTITKKDAEEAYTIVFQGSQYQPKYGRESVIFQKEFNRDLWDITHVISPTSTRFIGQTNFQMRKFINDIMNKFDTTQESRYEVIVYKNRKNANIGKHIIKHPFEIRKISAAKRRLITT